MTLFQAKEIIKYWNSFNYSGRVKTIEVIEAEKTIKGIHTNFKPERIIFKKKKKKENAYYKHQRKLLKVYSSFYDKDLSIEEFIKLCRDDKFKMINAPKLDLKIF